MVDEIHVSPRLVSVERPDGAARHGRVRRLLVGVLILAAAVAGVAYAWSRGSADGGKAITLVKEQSAQALARAQLGPQGRLEVDWSASPMGTASGEDVQMVEATLVSSDGRAARRATFMVDVDTGEVLAQDALAASLLGPGGKIENVHR